MAAVITVASQVMEVVLAGVETIVLQMVLLILTHLEIPSASLFQTVRGQAPQREERKEKVQRSAHLKLLH